MSSGSKNAQSSVNCSVWRRFRSLLLCPVLYSWGPSSAANSLLFIDSAPKDSIQDRLSYPERSLLRTLLNLRIQVRSCDVLWANEWPALYRGRHYDIPRDGKGLIRLCTCWIIDRLLDSLRSSRFSSFLTHRFRYKAKRQRAYIPANVHKCAAGRFLF